MAAALATQVAALLQVLFSTGFVDVEDNRALAAALYRAAKAQAGAWTISGGSHSYREAGKAHTMYSVQAEPPICAGTCGEPTPSTVGMCYQCQCEAHADGWFDMDEGYVRMSVHPHRSGL